MYSLGAGWGTQLRQGMVLRGVNVPSDGGSIKRNLVAPHPATGKEWRLTVTNLDKIVRRRANRVNQDLHNRRIIVMLEPGDTIAMRLERRRKVVRASINKVYWFMAKQDAMETAKKKALEKKLRKANKFE